MIPRSYANIAVTEVNPYLCVGSVCQRTLILPPNQLPGAQDLLTGIRVYPCGIHHVGACHDLAVWRNHNARADGTIRLAVTDLHGKVTQVLDQVSIVVQSISPGAQ
jgi:hypothetical protein